MDADEEMDGSQIETRPSPRPMTPEERAAALREAERFGVDLDHLRWYLKMTPDERLRRLQGGIRLVSMLRRARRL